MQTDTEGQSLQLNMHLEAPYAPDHARPCMPVRHVTEADLPRILQQRQLLGALEVSAAARQRGHAQHPGCDSQGAPIVHLSPQPSPGPEAAAA